MLRNAIAVGLAWRAETEHHERDGIWLPWIPLVVLTTIATVFRAWLAPWAFMWALSIAIFLGCKWETWVRARLAGSRATVARQIGYFLLWPGMDAPAFLDGAPLPAPPRPSAQEWLAAAAKTLAGGAFVWIAARKVAPANALLGGWIGMLGIVLVLHFGIFHLIALAWQITGVRAKPIMQAPARAASLAEFWGKRWNLGFRQLTHGLIFQPVRRRFGPSAATLAAFFVSGLIHDFVISFPARGGYGLPTGYFLLQGAGVLFERSKIGLRMGIDRGARGRAFALFCVAAPAFWLFHPLFIQRVMSPFLAWIGSR